MLHEREDGVMSAEIHYQRLNADNFTAHSLDDFVRHQTVTECWRKIDNGVLVGSSFQWLVKRPGSWVQINCTFRLIPQKSLRRHTGRLAVLLQRRSIRNWQQRSPLMSRWNADYKEYPDGYGIWENEVMK